MDEKERKKELLDEIYEKLKSIKEKSFALEREMDKHYKPKNKQS